MEPPAASVLNCRAADALAGDDEFHDLRRAIADLQPHDIAHASPVRQVLAPAVMAERQQALMDDVEGMAGAHPLAHGSLGHMRLAGVTQPECVVAKLADGGDLRLAFGQRKAHALKATDWLTEGLALLGVAPRLVQRHLGGAATLQADQSAAVVEALHHLREALALVAQAVADANVHIIEEHRAAPRDGTAHVVELGANHALGGRGTE